MADSFTARIDPAWRVVAVDPVTGQRAVLARFNDHAPALARFLELQDDPRCAGRTVLLEGPPVPPDPPVARAAWRVYTFAPGGDARRNHDKT